MKKKKKNDSFDTESFAEKVYIFRVFKIYCIRNIHRRYYKQKRESVLIKATAAYSLSSPFSNKNKFEECMARN